MAVSSPSDLRVALDAKHLPAVQADPRKAEALTRCAHPQHGFTEFLKYWYFKDTRTGKVSKLGEQLWPGQLEFIACMQTHQFIFALKARKLGFTTLETAFDGWVARFRDFNARVHLFSRRDDAALELLESVKFGLDRLPDWMRLPYLRSTNHEVHLYGGPDDTRVLKAYPAGEETAVEQTCTHGHIDEWARMRNPKKVWRAIEPSFANTAHILTTGMGPANYTSLFWRRCVTGDEEFHPFFVHALNRPDRTAEWLDKKLSGATDPILVRREYAMTPEDALAGEAAYLFTGEELDDANEDASGPLPALPGHVYIKAWDIGRHKDAAVGIVLDVTDTVRDVVSYERYRHVSYPMLGALIEATHEKYPGITYIEDNAAGEAVRENLSIPERQVEGFSTTGQSKPKLLTFLKRSFQQQVLRYDPIAYPNLDMELRGYQLPDTDLITDSVMSLAIGNYCAYRSPRKGKLREPVRF